MGEIDTHDSVTLPFLSRKILTDSQVLMDITAVVLKNYDTTGVILETLVDHYNSYNHIIWSSQ